MLAGALVLAMVAGSVMSGAVHRLCALIALDDTPLINDLLQRLARLATSDGARPAAPGDGTHEALSDVLPVPAAVTGPLGLALLVGLSLAALQALDGVTASDAQRRTW